ncbi:MAG TPA: hypothetical protein VHR72_04860, partial [Gemmataceae bacterium]|nr:hypothetical protein [Gemmataceae bacterium]
MSTGVIQRRHALGLPAGSVRATHALGVVALICGILLVPHATTEFHVPPYLIYLLFLILGHFFASHGVTIATRDDERPSPLYLPGGVVRFLIFAMIAGAIGWKLYSDPEGLKQQFVASVHELENQPEMPLIIIGGFMVGVVIRMIVGRDNPPLAWQEFEAWISILALVGLLVAAVMHLVIGASIESQFKLPEFEGVLG